MGVAISYDTTHPVEPSLREALTREADALEHDWWNESLILFEVPGRPGLLGHTKLFTLDVDPDDDTFMAMRDTSFILGKLAAWSAQHGLTWAVNFAGEDVGTVRDGALDERLTAWFADLSR